VTTRPTRTPLTAAIEQRVRWWMGGIHGRLGSPNAARVDIDMSRECAWRVCSMGVAVQSLSAVAFAESNVQGAAKSHQVAPCS